MAIISFNFLGKKEQTKYIFHWKWKGLHLQSKPFYFQLAFKFFLPFPTLNIHALYLFPFPIQVRKRVVFFLRIRQYLKRREDRKRVKNKKSSSLDHGVNALNRKGYFKSTYTPLPLQVLWDLWINKISGRVWRKDGVFCIVVNGLKRVYVYALPPFSSLLPLLIHIVSCYVIKNILTVT